jgi:hypothetical protein
MRREHLITAARVIFGLFYFGTGVAIALFYLFGWGGPPSQPTVAAQAFTDALSQSRFLDPLLALSYLVGGGALLFRRTAPLGLAVLAPVVLVIFTFHLVLSGQWMWGTLNLVWLLALAWQFRSAFRPLWTYALPSASVRAV